MDSQSTPRRGAEAQRSDDSSAPLRHCARLKQTQTISAQSKALRAGQTTCASILENCLSVIEQHEESLHAWVLVDREGAIAQAEALDKELSQGKPRGPLHGIPIGIKDIIDVAGLPTGMGSNLFGHSPLEQDALLVKRLRDAGAIIVGKTVTTQFAAFDPPETRNPWNTAHTPGGSSSGSAAAVAAGMCLGAVGTQTGGSIIRPASFCGIVGCKPTFGRISTTGVFPFAPSLDHPGPMGQTVGDVEIILRIMADSDIGTAPPITDPRLGRLRGMFEERAEPVMLEAFEQTISQFQSNGARIEEIELPKSFDDVIPSHWAIMCAEAAVIHKPFFNEYPDEYLPKMTSIIETGLKIDETELKKHRTHQAFLKREILGCFASVDALIAPATTGPAPGPETTGDPAFNSPWSYTGLPVVSIPFAQPPNGLPLALQLIAPPNQEAALFQLSKWAEQAVGIRLEA